MSDKLVKGAKLIGKMKPINAMIILVLVTLVLNTGLTQWNSKADREDRQALLEQIVILNEQNGELIRDQVQAKMVKICVKEEYDQAEEQWRETKTILGETLQENGISFPAKLNDALIKYDDKREDIKDCLIFPEKN